MSSYGGCNNNYYVNRVQQKVSCWHHEKSCFYESSQISEPTEDSRPETIIKQPLKEKNRKNCASYKHVPHKDKPPQIVARRNARERRRVQAVNSAFMRLRKVVPIQNTRGKRISKVKTLLNAIEYIQELSRILQDYGSYECDYETTRYSQYRDTGCADAMYFHDNFHY